MHILNVMLSKGAGGIEQASLDYARALVLAGCRVSMLTHPRAWANGHVPEGVALSHLPNRGQWDAVAMLRLAFLLRRLRPDGVIAHTNRALGLLLVARTLAGLPQLKLIAVAHNYLIRKHPRADAVLTITQDLAEKERTQGVPAHRVHVIPNMIAVPPRAARSLNPVPVIGTMGRFVAKKGFADYLQALALLKARGVAFTAVLGGGGEQEAALRALASELGLDDCLRFTGWVQDKAAFYRSLDVFCVPSLHEPFGIVLIEAFAHGVPVVSTATEGPCEIVTDGVDGVLVPKANPAAMADALAQLLGTPTTAQALAAAAYETVQTRYTHEVVGKALVAALTF